VRNGSTGREADANVEPESSPDGDAEASIEVSASSELSEADALDDAGAAAAARKAPKPPKLEELEELEELEAVVECGGESGVPSSYSMPVCGCRTRFLWIGASARNGDETGGRAVRG